MPAGSETAKHTEAGAKKPLIEVISETPAESTKEEAAAPRLDGELHYPSLLVVGQNDTPKQPLDDNPPHSPSEIPTLSRRPENLSQKMKQHVQASVRRRPDGES